MRSILGITRTIYDSVSTNLSISYREYTRVLVEKCSRSVAVYCIRNKVRIKILKALNVTMTNCWDVKSCTVAGTDVSA